MIINLVLILHKIENILNSIEYLICMIMNINKNINVQ